MTFGSLVNYYMNFPTENGDLIQYWVLFRNQVANVHTA